MQNNLLITGIGVRKKNRSQQWRQGLTDCAAGGRQSSLSKMKQTTGRMDSERKQKFCTGWLRVTMLCVLDIS